jgi:formate hydrogenlyase subunit 3/multisubunit Na+/H+ antiporter MnhD subunit
MRKKSKITIGFLGKTGIMMFTFYLSKTYTDFCRRLNAALLASAIILRGFRNFVDAVWDRDEESALAKLALKLEKTAGGFLLVLLTLVGLSCTSLESKWMPCNLLIPMEVLERGIISLVDNLM